MFHGLGLIMLDQSVDDFIDMTVHGLVEIVEGQVDAVIGDAPLGLVVRTYSFGAITSPDLGLAVVVVGLLRLVLGRLQQT